MTTGVSAPTLERYMARPKAAEPAPAGFLPVEYIGKRASHTDYGTRIFWAAVGAVQLVPEAIARKMVSVNHDVYRLAEYGGEPTPAAQAAKPQEDTQRQELDMVVQTMGKEALETYASTHYGQSLDKRRSVETMRQEVIRLIDQYGAP